MNANATPFNASVASVEILDTVFQRPISPPDVYMLDLIVSIELSFFPHKHEVNGDGNCGYYSIMNILIRHFRAVSPDHPSLLDVSEHDIQVCIS